MPERIRDGLPERTPVQIRSHAVIARWSSRFSLPVEKRGFLVKA